VKSKIKIMEPEKQLVVNTDAAMLAQYCNLMQIMHTQDEFLMDYFFATTQGNATLINRIAISPGHAKRVLTALQENVRRYEEKYGEIKPRPIPFEALGFTK
jgi:hypothetical protein